MNKTENVLQGVPPLRFWGEGAIGWYCLAGAVTRCLEYVGDPVSYPEVLAVAGAAWRLVWNPGQWSPDNLIMGWYGHLLAETRIADAFGYRYDFLDRRRDTPRTERNSENAVSARIRAEIDAGRPAIAIGIAGPEECLVAGYRESGKTLLVQSFFERSEGYLEVSGWYDEPRFLGLHLLSKTGERKSARQNLIEALQTAVEMAALPEAGGRAAGLAAYDAWADDMLDDSTFAGQDASQLEGVTPAISDNGIIVLCARDVAADYLTSVQDQVSSQAREHLLAAAALHRRESETMGAAHDQMPWGPFRHGDALLERVSRKNRAYLAQVIRECRDCYAQAMDHIALALQAEGI
jgi:hypothetical protein